MDAAYEARAGSNDTKTTPANPGISGAATLDWQGLPRRDLTWRCRCGYRGSNNDRRDGLRRGCGCRGEEKWRPWRHAFVATHNNVQASAGAVHTHRLHTSHGGTAH